MNLSDQISKHFRLSPPQKTALAKMRVQTVLDLLYHFPTRYTSTAEAVHVTSLTQGMKATIFGTISNLKTGKTFKSQMSMASARLTDETGTIELVWFNQPYIAKMIPDGSYVRVEGAVSERRKKKIENKAEDLGKTESSDVAENEGSTSKENPSPQLYLSNPEIEVIKEVPLAVGESLFKNATGQQAEFAHTLYPIYPESRGITSNWIYHAIKKVLTKLAQPQGELEMAPDPLPKEILDAYNLPSQKTAFIWIHNPLNEADARAARKRFAFEEIFFIQLYKQKKRLEYASHAAFIIDPDKNANLAGRSQTNSRTLENFISRFPFPLSGAQKRAIDDIMLDMKSGAPMERLLEGDVGSGKTAVAATSAFAVVTSKPSVSLIKKNAEKEAKKMRAQAHTLAKTGMSTSLNIPPKIKLGDGKLQVAYMCPTEILATQHFESFIKYFEYLGISVALMTGSGCRKFPSKVNPKGWTDISRAQLLKWVASGEIPIVIGTHALLQKTVVFKNLGLVIIDEQHRFGTAQRSSLVRKDHIAPHLLSMTATPIPRTLALTMYGDLDLSLLDEMPVGRKPVVTKIVVERDRDDAYSHIRTLLEEGRQAYVICPRIDAPDPDKETALNAKSVIEEAKRLKKDIFKESKWQIGIMHGKMKSDDKERVMRDFSEGKINILCSTSVIEVGVNVPNATVMIIEGSERFGLSQLHQLRGRIMRSSYVPYCYVFTSAKNGNAGGPSGGTSSNASTNSATEETLKRLKAFTSAKNGFELAEYDLALRGSGELYNGKQWGVSDIAMDALRNLKMVEAARREAGRILAQYPTLTNHPLLKEQISHPDFEKLHFE